MINYSSKTFIEYKDDLIKLIRQMYPEVMGDFSDSSIGSMLIDLNAAIADNLTVNIDRVFQETQIENAQQRNSILNIAKNLGFNIPTKRPSVTVVDFSVLIPVLGDSLDTSYYPTLSAGAQIIGGGKIFETQDVVDWNSPFSNLGDNNRSIVPNFDANGIIVSYVVTKREVVLNGSTSIFRKAITTDNVEPFFQIILPDPNIIEIQEVILMEGVNFTTNPNESDFKNQKYRYYEVDYLAQQRIFVENTLSSMGAINPNNVKSGKWIDTTKKFLKEYTSNGYCKLIFGSGDPDGELLNREYIKEGINNRKFLKNFLNNTSLGEKLKDGHTLFVKYRTGGGSNSNVGSRVLTKMGNHSIKCNGSRQDYVQNVIKSLSVTNPIPAIGGNDGLSIEQIRHLIKYNFSSQNRSLSLTDYIVQIYKMPGKFGSPFRVNAWESNNKIVISILDIGYDGKLSNTSNSLLKENIVEYLSQYRMINDYIEIKDGKIINIALEIDVYVENISDNQIVNNIINAVSKFFDINNHEMNEDIFIGKIQNIVLNVNGVLNVLNIKAYNKVGGEYSNNVISQEIINNVNGEIKLINNTIYSTEDSMFEIKYPTKDILVKLRKKTT